MALPKIVKAPATILSTPATIVSEVTDELVKLSKTMNLVMRKAKGIGLAATQIGRPESMFIYLDGMRHRTLFNPEVLVATDPIVDKEGCLSLPGQWYNIERPSYVRIKALDLDGEEIEIEAEDLMARCFFHEIDHLQGILLSDGE